MDRTWLELQGIRRHMVQLVFISLLMGGSIIAQAVFLAQSIALLFENRSVTEAYVPLSLFITSWVSRHSLAWLQRKVSGEYAERRAEELRAQLLESVFHDGSSVTAKQGSGPIVTLILEGADRFRSYLDMSISRFIDMLCITGLLLLWIFKLDYLSALIMAVTLPILVIFFILLGLAARKQADKQWRSYRMLSHHFIDSLRGLQTLRFLGRSRQHSRTVDKVSNQYRKSTMRTLRIAFLSSFSLDFFSMLSVAFVAVALGIRLVEGSLGIEIALAVLLLAPEYFSPIRMLGSDYHASLDGKEAGENIRSLIREGKSYDNDVEVKDTQLPPVQNTDVSIRLNDIDVLGDAGVKLLDHFSVEIPQSASRIGIIGASGAGKTTLLRLLSGFIEGEKGSFQVNDVSISGRAKAEWQRRIAYIPQHPYLFSQSLADNIRFYAQQAPQEEVERAINAVGLREMTEGLPNGSATAIGEGGRTLSGGQAQRVALARMLLSDRPIILLDEPTAHLDIETEYELKQTILSVLKDKKMIMATHRLHWMPEMDFILVLRNGKLEESGTHQQLIKRKGIYMELMRQNREAE